MDEKARLIAKFESLLDAFENQTDIRYQLVTLYSDALGEDADADEEINEDLRVTAICNDIIDDAKRIWSIASGASLRDDKKITEAELEDIIDLASDIQSDAGDI